MEDRPKVGLGVYIRRHGKILLGRRLSAHGEGQWCPPGGHLEKGESFETGARREVAEECGLMIAEPRLAFVTNDLFPDGKHYVTLAMVADWQGGEPDVCEPDKLVEWGWFGSGELPHPLFLSVANALRQGFSPF